MQTPLSGCIDAFCSRFCSWEMKPLACDLVVIGLASQARNTVPLPRGKPNLAASRLRELRHAELAAGREVGSAGEVAWERGAFHTSTG